MVFGLFGGDDKKNKDDKNVDSSSKDKESTSKSSSSQPGFQTALGCTALVTGSSGLCGARLVEMLLERGASTVICFDLASPSEALQQRLEDVVRSKTPGSSKPNILFRNGAKDGDLTNAAAVEQAFQIVPKIDVVFHIAALVGPFHDKEKYYDVNYQGTLTIIEMCKKYKVPKLV